MRIRQVKPSFWTDEKVAELAPAVRLTYIGLWMVADDGGWFRWSPATIANELYGYDPRKARERNIVQHAEALAESGRIVFYGCGHAFIPHLKDHQRLAGETHQVRGVQREHAGCASEPASPRGSPRFPGTVRLGNGEVRSGQERKGNGSLARAPEDGATLKEIVGWKPPN